MFRKLLVALSAIALVLGLAPAAHAQSGTADLENFRVTMTVDGSSDIRPGGTIRLNVKALNTDSGFPYTTTYLYNWGVHAPTGFTFNSFGGQIADHFTRAPNWHGGSQTDNALGVARGSERNMWVRLNIPNDIPGGTVLTFGAGVEKNLTGRRWVDKPDMVKVTMPTVGTSTTVSADPATVEEGGNTTLRASVAPRQGSVAVNAGTIDFRVNGASIGSVPVDAAGRASIPYTVPLLDDRTPITQNITAVYSGDTPRFSGSQGTTTVTVNPEPKAEVTSTVGLTATRGLVKDGQLPVILDVTVDTSDGNDLPDGAKVEILRDGVVLDTVAANGVTASYTDHLDVNVSATYTYTARLLESETYDTIYRAAESDPVEFTVSAEVTPEVTVAVDPTSVLVGRPVDISTTLTANGDPLPAGVDVIIRANGRDLGTVQIDENGEAALPGHVFTSPGTKTVQAVFEGGRINGVTYAAVTSSPVELTVDPLPEVDSDTVIELQTKATAGDEVTITAVVSRLDGRSLNDAELDDLGSVWFFQDGKAVGSAPVAIDPVTGQARAVFVHRFAERGEYRMTADYSGTSSDSEVIGPSETAQATLITVLPSEIVIDEPGPPPTPGGGSLDLGSLMGEGSGSLGSLTGMSSGN